MTQTKIDWSGTQLFVGLDIHKETWVATVRTAEVFLKTFATNADKDVLLKSFERQWPGAKIKAVYEAGYFGYYLADFLNSKGIETIIVAPHTIPVAPGSFVKTDRIDSRKLAFELAKGSLVGIYHRSERELLDRSLIRKRRQLVKRRLQIMLQVKGELVFYGVAAGRAASPYWSRWTIEAIKALPFKSEQYRKVLGLFVEEYQALCREIRVVDGLLLELAMSERYKETVALLRTVPGVGPLIAMCLLLEISDIHRFQSAQKFVSYLGLTPSEFSSGNALRKGSLTGMGHSYLRTLLVQAAWTAIRRDPVLMMKYQRLCVGKSKGKAIIGVAKSLANRIRRVWLYREAYATGVV
jgi:transposase